MICAYLSVLFGKRFDSHGLVEGSGYFHVPTLSQFDHLCDPRLPQNSHAPRADFSIPLNLAEVARIEPLVSDDQLDPRFLGIFRGATKFYLRALQNVERDAEVAYLHLITAGEILSGFYEYSEDDLLDEQTKRCLDQVRCGVSDGPQLAKFISGRLFQVKRRFVETIVRLVDPSFFDRTESSRPFPGFKTDSFRKSVAAAYDLRSRYLHTGDSFGGWVSLNHGGNELQFGRPVVKDKELSKILASAPTYVGLERIVRYCLLRFAHEQGVYVESAPEQAGRA